MKCLAIFSYLTIVYLAMLNTSARADLIILAAPMKDDPYYAEVAEEIFDFHIQFARQIQAPDEVLILTDDQFYDQYVKALGQDKVVKAPMSDIWMRDFTTVNPSKPVMFRYTAEGQGGGTGGQRQADAVQDQFANMLAGAGMSVPETDLLLDGGNYVDDYAGNVVLSRKFLRDNDLTEEAARIRLRDFSGAKNVAFIEADEQGGLEHADGVVSFIDVNTLLVNAYPDDPDYADQLKIDLYAGLPNVKIYEIVAPYDDRVIYDDKFGSACGLYTNALVTQQHIYFPQFGIPEDQEALERIKSLTSRKVIPVASGQVCHMGGGVRCMSWQLQGEAAIVFKEYVNATLK